MNDLFKKKFNLWTIIDKIKCVKCKLIFESRSASRGDGLFFVDSLKCNKCKKLVLINSHYVPYKHIENYFRENKIMKKEGFVDGKDLHRFLSVIEAMIEPCDCGGEFFFILLIVLIVAPVG